MALRSSVLLFVCNLIYCGFTQVTLPSFMIPVTSTNKHDVTFLPANMFHITAAHSRSWPLFTHVYGLYNQLVKKVGTLISSR